MNLKVFKCVNSNMIKLGRGSFQFLVTSRTLTGRNTQVEPPGGFLVFRNPPGENLFIFFPTGAASEPKLSVTRPAGGGVALQCTADCWLPEPRISFLDGRGDVIEADEPKRDQDARGCFSVGLTATLQDASGRWAGRVHLDR